MSADTIRLSDLAEAFGATPEEAQLLQGEVGNALVAAICLNEMSSEDHSADWFIDARRTRNRTALGRAHVHGAEIMRWAKYGSSADGLVAFTKWGPMKMRRLAEILEGMHGDRWDLSIFTFGRQR